ncbi:hypothetical protein FJTKL_11904 [Diaporthe vaccinii]|uniref:LPXTG-domain-containing protein n=1 Tax=Diaporthe vaccinii TaxID=105482 RepID=A0ABR4FAH5_9PEZI
MSLVACPDGPATSVHSSCHPPHIQRRLAPSAEKMWLLPRFSKPRDNNSSINGIPNTCWDVCNNAILEAQSRGKTGGLCDSGSAFNNYLQACNSCIDLKDVGSTDRSAIDSALAPYIEYCKATDATTAAADITSFITWIDSSWHTTLTELIPTTLEAPDSVGGKSYLQTMYKPSMAVSTRPEYFFHLSVGSIVSSYIPASIFSQLAYSVSLSAGAASVTGDATSLIYAALEATSVPSWFSAAVPAIYSSQMHTLQEEINQLRATPISLALGSTSEPTSLASSTPSTAPETQRSKAWIAGPVVGGIAAICLFTLGVFIYQRRRRRRAAAQPELKGDTFQETGDKPQLHSDHLPPRYLYEMDASQAPSEADHGALPEMAANEAPARELAADDHHSRASAGGEDAAHAETSAEDREKPHNVRDAVETRS